MTAPATPLPRPRIAVDAAHPRPVVFARSLAEIDRDLADLEVREARHREQLEGTRRALVDVATCRLRLLEQRARSLTVLEQRTRSLLELEVQQLAPVG